MAIWKLFGAPPPHTHTLRTWAVEKLLSISGAEPLKAGGGRSSFDMWRRCLELLTQRMLATSWILAGERVPLPIIDGASPPWAPVQLHQAMGVDMLAFPPALPFSPATFVNQYKDEFLWLLNKLLFSGLAQRGGHFRWQGNIGHWFWAAVPPRLPLHPGVT